jgi:hypothetical protein
MRLGIPLAGVVVAVAVILATVTVGSAQANSPVKAFSMTPTTTQAGGHPDLHVFVEFESADSQGENPETECACADLKDLLVHAPPGFIGDPHATPQCDAADFGSFECPTDSQVGVLETSLTQRVGVYNLVPHPSQAGLLGVNLPLINSPIYIVADARTESDYGLDADTLSITHPLPLVSIDFQLWGIPADPSHTPERYRRGCEPSFGGEESCLPGVPSNAPPRPFLDNPTTCGVPLTAEADLVAYDRGTSHASAPFPSTTGCDQLSFNPSLFGQPTTVATDTASGFDADLQVPQGESPTAPAASAIRATTVTLPEGFSINANAADGKEACSDAEARIGTREQARCPENAKIGTLSVSSSALPGLLPGYVYLGEPKPGERYRLLLVADGFNLHVKLPGKVEPDPVTGQLTVSFQDLPQFPFSDFNIHFFGAERGLLATPTQCGTYPVITTFRPWDSLLPEQTSTQYFSLDSGPEGTPCPGPVRPFDPSFQAGVTDKSAGVHAPFVLKLSRSDGQQNLTDLDVAAPSGFAATLKGIPYCPESAIAQFAGSVYSGLTETSSSLCPSASQVGTLTAGAGAGSRPLYVSGKVYLAGPYKGAPLSLEAVIPAVSGPYDLGNIAIRVALYVDPASARVSAVSDPFPRIIGGVVLRTRMVQVNLDRKDFTLNPTNCDPLSIGATIFGDQGAQAGRRAHFQVANCAVLPYRPQLSFRLTGGVERRGHPAIHAVLKTSPGEANSRRVQVTMPKSELLDNAHIGTICTRVQFSAKRCPSGSLIGVAEAITPLLDQPLEGKVYLRSSSHELPDVVIDLQGQIDVELVGRIDTVNGRGLRTTFETVPDAPISSFALDLKGGSKGLLQNSESLCTTPKQASVSMAGQNGRTVHRSVPLNPACGKAGHKRHRRGHRQIADGGKEPRR